MFKDLREEIIIELSKIKDEISKEPDIQCFMENWEEFKKRNEERDEMLRRSQIIDGTVLLKLIN